MHPDRAALKMQAAHRAVEFIESGMIVGLGHGSTAAFAVQRIAELLHSGELHHIRAVPCSRAVLRAARRLRIPLVSLNQHPVVDLTIDGADEVDEAMNLIKGGGGALLKEKIVAQASRREIIIVDESKLSARLGMHGALPVEVAPDGWRTQVAFLEGLGARVTLRRKDDGTPFKTDRKNVILDADFGPIENPAQLARDLNGRAGIVEQGLFIDLATDIIIAGEDGVRHLTRR
jgi:ribose 5-phosphate isomerase A